MSTDTHFPVIREMNLPAVPSKLFGRSRRDLGELPPSPPGTALVFQVDGQFHVYDARRRLTGNEEFVTEALAVAVVDMRPRQFFADLTAHSKHPSEDFTIRMSCETVVERPELVTRLGAVDLPRIVIDHLSQDREIAEICGRRRIEDVAEVRKMIDARVRANFKSRPPNQPGLQITLQRVEVLTPVGLAERDRATLLLKQSHSTQMLENELNHERRLQVTDHDQEHQFVTTEWDRRQRYRGDHLEAKHEAKIARMKRDLERRAEELEWEYRTRVEQLEADQRLHMVGVEHRQRMRELTLSEERTALEWKAEDDKAGRMKQYYEAGVAGLLTLAAAQGLITPLQMVDMLREDELKAFEHIRALINSLIGEGRADLVSVDLQTMVDTLQTKLLGRLAARPEHALAGAGARASGAVGELGAREEREEREGDDEDPPGEDEFH